MRLFIFDKKMIIFGLKTIAGLYIIKQDDIFLNDAFNQEHHHLLHVRQTLWERVCSYSLVMHV